jgi:hypothetical protein
MAYPPPPGWPAQPSPGATQLRSVALALIILGAFDLILGVLSTLGRIVSTTQATVSSDDPAATAGQLTYVVFTLLSIVVGALVLTAGIQLNRRKGRGLGIAGAVLGLLPLSCGFAAGIPVGIWALIVLGRPDVRALLSTR